MTDNDDFRAVYGLIDLCLSLQIERGDLAAPMQLTAKGHEWKALKDALDDALTEVSAPAPDLGAQGEPVAWGRYTVLSADHRRRIQALGAAISLRDWFGVEKAHAEIRDAFDRPDIYDPTSTDNLRSRNRPAAWAYEYLASDGWQRALWWECPSELPQYKSRPERCRNIRPLYEAPTPPSGVETTRQDSEGTTDA